MFCESYHTENTHKKRENWVSLKNCYGEKLHKNIKHFFLYMVTIKIFLSFANFCACVNNYTNKQLDPSMFSN